MQEGHLVITRRTASDNSWNPANANTTTTDKIGEQRLPCRRLEGYAQDLAPIIFCFQDGLPAREFMDGDVAAQNGHLELLKTGQVKEVTSQAMDLAAANGHLDVVMWLHENRKEGCTTEAMDEAAKNGHLDVLMWLHENRQEGCTGGAMDMASRHGHLEVLKFLHDHRSEGCSTLAVDFAAHNGHTEVVKWLFENRQEGCTPAAAEGAARQGHDEIVKYLKGHKRGRSVDYNDLGAVLAQART